MLGAGTALAAVSWCPSADAGTRVEQLNGLSTSKDHADRVIGLTVAEICCRWNFILLFICFSYLTPPTFARQNRSGS